MAEYACKPDMFEISLPGDELSSLFPPLRAERNPQGRVYFAIVLRGQALVEIDGRGYLLQAQTLLFLLPGHLLLQLTKSRDFCFRYLSFEFDYLADFPLLLKTDISDRANTHPCMALEEATFHLMERYYDFISERYRESTNRTEVTKGILFSFIMEVSQLYAGREVSVKVTRQNELVDSFFSLLHKHFKRERSAVFYADRLCISDKHLMRCVKKMTGYTLHFWISDFVVREAKLLLRSTDKSVMEITDELHFPNSSFFARFFRKYTGMSPTQFRDDKGVV